MSCPITRFGTYFSAVGNRLSCSTCIRLKEKELLRCLSFTMGKLRRKNDMEFSTITSKLWTDYWIKFAVELLEQTFWSMKSAADKHLLSTYYVTLTHGWPSPNVKPLCKKPRSYIYTYIPIYVPVYTHIHTHRHICIFIYVLGLLTSSEFLALVCF